MDLLLTAFAPWGDRTSNPTMAVARDLEGARIRGDRVLTIVLPVDFQRAPAILEAEWGRTRPRAVLAMGLAERRATIDVERVARNRRALERNAVEPAGGESFAPLVPGAPDGLRVPLPVERLVAGLIDRGFPARLSDDAGTFVCNALFYRMILKRLESPDAPSVCFVHIPWTTHTPVKDLERPGAGPGSPLPADLVSEAVTWLLEQL